MLDDMPGIVLKITLTCSVIACKKHIPWLTDNNSIAWVNFILMTSFE